MTEGLLDLSGADTSGFVALDAGDYNAVVHEVELTEVKNDGKVPAGTPMIKFQFSITDEEAKNRRAFQNYVLDHPDAEKKKRTLGALVRTLAALGVEKGDEAKIKAKGFNFDKLQDLVGVECVIRLKQKPKYQGEKGEMDNEIVAIKPAGTASSNRSSSGGAGLI